MIERAGLWRRGLAAVIDLLVAQLLLQVVVAVGFGATSGRVTTSFTFYTACRPALVEPAGWPAAAGFGSRDRNLCTSSLFGLSTRAVYVVRGDAKPGTPAVSRSAAVSPDGSVVVRALSLDWLFWPTFIVLRWLMDRSLGGSPGRRLTRIAVTDRDGTASGREFRPLLARRYARFAWPYGPGTAMLAATATLGAATGSVPTALVALTWLASSALVGVAHLAAVMAIFRHQETFYDDPAGTAVAPRLEIARAKDMCPDARVPTVPGPWRDLGGSVRAAWDELPWLSMGLAVVLALVFAGELLLPWTPASSAGVSVETMMAWGGMDRQLVVASHQAYRLLASIFLHANLAHLLVNASALVVAGWLLERLLGRALFLGIFLIGGLAGSTASIVFNPLQQISIGASGAVLALFAAMVGVGAALPAGDGRRWRLAWAATVCLPALLPVVPLPDVLTADRADHAGGELAGLLMGVVVAIAWRRRPRWPSRRVAAAAAAVLSLLVVASVAAGGFRAPSQSATIIPPALVPKDQDEGVREAASLAARYPDDPRALLFLAQADVLARRPDEAERDLDRSLAAAERLNPSGVATDRYTAHLVVGGRFTEIGDLDAAIAQYTSALASRTEDGAAFRQRGIAEFYEERAAPALTDLDSAVMRTPRDAYAALWDHIVAVRAWRSNRDAALRNALQEGSWPAPVLKFFLGEIDAGALERAADDPDPKTAGERRCEADFYRGERLLMEGDAGGARPLMLSATGECPHTFIEYGSALSELEGRGAGAAR